MNSKYNASLYLGYIGNKIGYNNFKLIYNNFDNNAFGFELWIHFIKN